MTMIVTKDAPSSTSSSSSKASASERTSSASPDDKLDQSTSYDELMQTVIWVPPSHDHGVSSRSEIDADMEVRRNGDSGGSEEAQIPETEATESARDAPTSTMVHADAPTNRGTAPSPPLPDTGEIKNTKDTSLKNGAGSNCLVMEPISFAAMERNVFDMAEVFRKAVMKEMESMKGWFLLLLFWFQ